uniref:Sema domain-containing protein n=1 Tax=Macrostomum lignano TaxID=282301 RepID=A0A1I8F5J1_9PLAT
MGKQYANGPFSDTKRAAAARPTDSSQALLCPSQLKKMGIAGANAPERCFRSVTLFNLTIGLNGSAACRRIAAAVFYGNSDGRVVSIADLTSSGIDDPEAAVVHRCRSRGRLRTPLRRRQLLFVGQKSSVTVTDLSGPTDFETACSPADMRQRTAKCTACCAARDHTLAGPPRHRTQPSALLENLIHRDRPLDAAVEQPVAIRLYISESGRDAYSGCVSRTDTALRVLKSSRNGSEGRHTEDRPPVAGSRWRLGPLCCAGLFQAR